MQNNITDPLSLLNNIESKKFVTDKDSNMPRFIETTVPTDIVKKIIQLPGFAFFETDTPDTFIVRKKHTLRPAVSNILEYRDKLVELIPELAVTFEEAGKIRTIFQEGYS